MNGILAPMIISLITFFVLGMTTTSSLLPSINLESAFAQTDTPIPEDGSNNNLNNNSIAYSYNIYNNNNTFPHQYSKSNSILFH